ncbi:competence/damage-inducible protein A [Globicatella sanguinis]|uniref:competence/damage-inducible protein A n=1 Tax=Globicatella sanguinis TaxID=13076 RepID=UPI002542DF81|nr:competence/damage-inducible protein A [Globicatella sanguinis]MDK7630432.1 competence/damage-inducible protein A [Globicatella sanguinis]WIK66991.1 competence/damage-inducible protein A [Globicatella sanguinis]WKT56396.1 competence/damage-inducible protein A [Globicatella sanguinis]
MKVELISCGTELLLGDIINTNAAYLANELANIGVNIYKQTTVGDNPERFKRALELAFEAADTVIITGGLGPTDDDLTRDVAAEFMGMPLEFQESVWEEIVDYLMGKNPNYQLADNNRKQAMVPQGAIILHNPIGTAPGLILDKDERRIILMPGPPREMKRMYHEQVEPYLKSKSHQVFASCYVRFFGIGESLLETKIKDILDQQTNPTMALYAKTAEVLLRVTASGENETECLSLIETALQPIKERVGEYIYLVGTSEVSETQTEMHRVLARTLIDNQLTISVAESLTGGDVASLLIEQSGVSQVFKEGIVCYSNESKISTVGVKESTLNQFGAVSSEVAREMVMGVAQRLNADVAIATTGLAGPESDESGKPVGLVYVGTYYKGQAEVKEYHFFGDRALIRDRAAKNALNQLRLMINRVKDK